MAISWESMKTQHADRAPRLVIHGQPKVGKTTVACSAPNPIVLATEDGLGRSAGLEDVPAFEVRSYRDMMDALNLLANDPRDRKTVVIDSEDHWEPMVQAEICRREGKASIEDFSYGRGLVYAAELYRDEYNEALRYLQREKGLMIIHVCHSLATKENPPDMLQGFTRWSLKMDRRIADLLREEADGIFYAAIPVITAVQETGFNAKQIKAVGAGDRRLYCQPNGAYLAGSRWAIPDYIPLKWDALAPYLTGVPTA